MYRSLVAILALALGAGLTACDRIPIAEILAGTRDREEEEKARDKAELEQMREDVYAMVGEADCNSLDDCRFIGFGSKPCGGPWEFLVYSVKRTDPAELADVVAEYNALEDTVNQKHGYGSDCSVPNEPTLGVLGGRCVDLGDQGGKPAWSDSLFVSVVESPQDVPESHAYSLLDAHLDGETLRVKVSHSGGCAEHEFTLWAMPGPYMSPLPQYDLVLTHRDPDDPCDGIVEAELSFLLKPLLQAHGNGALIVLHLDGWTFELQPKQTDPNTSPDSTVVAPPDTIAVPPFGPGVDSLIVVNAFDAGLGGTDPFWLGDVRIEEDILTLVVSYSGGCEEHEFALWTTPEYAESIPAQHGLILTHNGNGDSCEAAVSQELRFDISPLKALHPADTQVVLIRVGSPIDSAGIEKDYVL